MTPIELILLGALIAVIGCVLYGDIRRRLRIAPPNKADSLVIAISADTKQFNKDIEKSIALLEKFSAASEKSNIGGYQPFVARQRKSTPKTAA